MVKICKDIISFIILLHFSCTKTFREVFEDIEPTGDLRIALLSFLKGFMHPGSSQWVASGISVRLLEIIPTMLGFMLGYSSKRWNTSDSKSHSQ